MVEAILVYIMEALCQPSYIDCLKKKKKVLKVVTLRSVAKHRFSSLLYALRVPGVLSLTRSCKLAQGPTTPGSGCRSANRAALQFLKPSGLQPRFVIRK